MRGGYRSRTREFRVKDAFHFKVAARAVEKLDLPDFAPDNATMGFPSEEKEKTRRVQFRAEGRGG